MLDLFIGRFPADSSNTFRVDAKIRGANTGRQYRVLDRVSSGGNGVVHLCVDERTGDERAVKFHLKMQTNRLARFEREVDLMAKIRHQHLIQYVDDGRIAAKTTKGVKQLPFVVMERAQSNLREVIGARKTGAHYEEYIGQFRGLAEALAKLHIYAVHRDIKPENILVIGDRWVLSDFGLCALTVPKGRALTHIDEPIGPRYWMSPEAINRVMGCKDVANKASDVFQLASVFWYVVTGRHPTGIVDRDDWTGPDHLFQILFKCLSHQFGRRPSDGMVLSMVLEEAIKIGDRQAPP